MKTKDEKRAERVKRLHIALAKNAITTKKNMLDYCVYGTRHEERDVICRAASPAAALRQFCFRFAKFTPENIKFNGITRDVFGRCECCGVWVIDQVNYGGSDEDGCCFCADCLKEHGGKA